jgi:hypothetical protein
MAQTNASRNPFSTIVQPGPLGHGPAGSNEYFDMTLIAGGATVTLPPMELAAYPCSFMVVGTNNTNKANDGIFCIFSVTSPNHQGFVTSAANIALAAAANVAGILHSAATKSITLTPATSGNEFYIRISRL